MDSLTFSLLGGFIGSTITVIVTKILDFFSQRDKNRFELRKQFFEKKLQAAETAISTFHKGYTLYTSLANLYETLGSQEHDLNNEFFTEMNETLSTRLTNLEEVALTSHNAYALFFDIRDENGVNRTLYSRFYQCISELMNLQIPMQTAISLYNEKKDEPIADFLWEKVEEVGKDMKAKCLELSMVLRMMNQESDRQMMIIKREMKKYE